MYNSYMTNITATHARQRWAETLDAARISPVTVTEHGRETVTILEVELARRALQALEDAEDAAAADEALVQMREGAPTFALEDVAHELGITLA